MSTPPPLTIVTGAIDAGKTRHAQRICASGSSAGFASPKVFESGELAGYDLEALPSAQRMPLARLGNASPGTDWFRFRRFFFNPAAFEWARAEAHRLLGAARPASTRLVLDEVGPLEAEGRGFHPVLELFLDSPFEVVVTTRASLVAWLCSRAAGRPVRVEEPGGGPVPYDTT